MRINQYILELQKIALEHGDDLLVVTNTTSDVDFKEVDFLKFVDLDTLDVYELKTLEDEIIKEVVVV